MTNNGFMDNILQTYRDGLINKYIYDRLSGTTGDGLTEELTGELIQHARDASDFGVENDRDFAIYFFIDRFTDDILDDTFGAKISPDQRKDLCRFIFGHRDQHKLDDLTDYRLLTHKWINNKVNKKAYPNISGKENREPTSNLDKWISTLKKIYSSIHDEKMGRSSAIDYFTNKWDVDEKQKFINWMRYYEDGTTEKYSVKNANLTKEALLPSSWTNGDRDEGMNMTTYRSPEKTEQEKDLMRPNNIEGKCYPELIP